MAYNRILPYNLTCTASIFTKIWIYDVLAAGIVLEQTELKSVNNSTCYHTYNEKDNQMGLYSDFTYFYRLLLAACQ